MRDEYRALGTFGTVGLEIALSIFVGGYAGHWADGRFGTPPYLMLVGGAIGVGAGIKSVLRAYREMQRIAAREEKHEGNPAPLFDAPSDVAEAKKEKARARDEEESPPHEGEGGPRDGG